MGLEDLTDLRELNLSCSQIKEIKGLEHLKNLQALDLGGNPLKEHELDLLARYYGKAQEFVKYCQEKVKKAKT